ncbi:hypothetical protein [Dyella flagellata]|uniref:Carboxypeptidase regulatory-like domain-containing protein n=1 Tax=Dyella flagellata TaxID=1867833 RepID=A0ABQ5XE27_9GAMM|nr:hypothetical protein [Dyella flagellata]GLQ89909.1 hypothetical protein GCM10007898_34840 [Dyella flagellata]
MSYETVTVDSYQYSVAFDGPLPVRAHPWAIAQGSVTDELTGAAPPVIVTIQVQEPGLSVVGGKDGQFALVAVPWQRFSMFDGGALLLHLHASASGYVDLDWQAPLLDFRRHIATPIAAAGTTVITLDNVQNLYNGQSLWFGPTGPKEEMARIVAIDTSLKQVTLGAPLQFTHTFGDVVVADEYASTVLDPVTLRRTPTVLRGRVFRRDDATQSTTPISGAQIALTDFWRSLPALRAMLPGAMTDPNPTKRQFALACGPGVYLSHPVGMDVHVLPLATVPGADKTLAQPCASGASQLSLTDRIGVTANDVLQVGDPLDDASELVSVQSIPVIGSDVEPTTLPLSMPVHAAYSAGTRVQVLQPQVPGVNMSLRDATAPEDRCIFVDDTSTLPPLCWIDIDAAHPEYQRAQLPAATTDKNGYFRFPPIQRIAAMQLTVTSGGSPPVTLTVQPDYALAENWLDIVMP